MESFSERLKRLVAEQLKEVDPTDVEKVQQFAAIQTAVEDALNEKDEIIQKKDASLVEISTAYKEVVTHQSFTPNSADKAKTEVSPEVGLNALFQELFGN